MKSLGLRGKLVLTLLVPSCIVVGSLLYLYNNDLNEALRQKYVEEAMLASLKLQASTASIQTLQDTETLQRSITEFLSFYPQFLRVSIYGPAGTNPTVLASSDTAEIGRTPDGWDVAAMLTGKPQVHEDNKGGMDTLELTVPIISQGTTIGAIGLYALEDPMNVLVNYLRTRVFVLGPLGIGLLLVILYLSVNKMVVRPVRALAEHSETIASGNYNVNVPISGENEVSKLGQSFNQMCSSILAARLSLEQSTRQRELILNSAGEGIYGLDLEGKTTFINPAGASMLGWHIYEMIGKPQHELIHHTTADGTPYLQAECPIYAAIQDGTVHHVNNEVFWRKDGSNFPVEYTSTPIRENDKVVGAVVTFSDITERKEAEETLRKNQIRMKRQNQAFVELTKNHPLDCNDLKTSLVKITESTAHTLEVERVSVWLYNDDRSKIRCSDLYEIGQNRHTEGFELAAADYPSYFEAIEVDRAIVANDAHTDSRTKEFSQSYLSMLGISSMLDAAIRIGGKTVGVVCHEHVGPARQWALDEENFAGSIADMVALAMEQFERNRAQEALRASEARFSGILDIAHEAIISIDERQKIIIFNKGAEQIFGYTQGEAIGQTVDFLIPQRFHTAHRTHIGDFAASPTSGRQMGERREIFGCRKNGEEFAAEATISKLEVGGQKIFTVVLRDITERKEAERTLAEQAIRDSLTNLYNRRYFNRRMDDEIARADRNGHSLAILLCDLDHFKAVNDTRGHHIGDEILKGAAKGIQESTRGTDLVFRWGGDEIVVVLADSTREGVLIAAERMRKATQRLRELGHHELDLSIGVALYPEHGHDLNDLVRLADRALYIAKKGGDKIHIGEEEYELGEQSVKVVFQVLMDVRSDQILGYEALSRDPQGKLSIFELFKAISGHWPAERAKGHLL